MQNLCIDFSLVNGKKAYKYIQCSDQGENDQHAMGKVKAFLTSEETEAWLLSKLNKDTHWHCTFDKSDTELNHNVREHQNLSGDEKIKIQNEKGNDQSKFVGLERNTQVSHGDFF